MSENKSIKGNGRRDSLKVSTENKESTDSPLSDTREEVLETPLPLDLKEIEEKKETGNETKSGAHLHVTSSSLNTILNTGIDLSSSASASTPNLNGVTRRRGRIRSDAELLRSPNRRRMSLIMSSEQIELSSANEFTGPTDMEILRLSRRIDDKFIQAIRSQTTQQKFKLGDILDYFNSGVQVIVEDDFSQCFKRRYLRPWNWNFYLMIFWCVGVVFRYLILFPLRLIIMSLSIFICWALLTLFSKMYASDSEADAIKRKQWELWTIQLLARSWMFAWFAVIDYKGVIPKKEENQIYVANHSTMLDILLLMQITPVSAVGQLHSTKPFIAWLQLELLKSLECIWFNRKEAKDRTLAARKIKAHIADVNKPRLILFPEGTCVNNEYVIQFKRGAFGMGAQICPIAIKYNKTFLDAYWISRERPFHWHLFDIMTSWAMVAEVHWLEPQTRGDGESSEDFAARVKAMIAKAGGMTDTHWNGYLKHYRPSDRVIQEQKKIFIDRLEDEYAHLLAEADKGNVSGSASAAILRQRK